MNKKLITGICVSIAAVIVIVVAILAVSSSIKPTDTDQPDSPSASQGSEQTEGTQSDNESQESGSGASSGSSSPTGSSASSSDASNSSSETSSGNSSQGGVTPPPVEAEKGENFSVPIIIKENPGMVMAHMEIKYDAEKFEYQGYGKGNIFEDYDVIDNKKGKITLIAYSEDSLFVDTDRNGTLIALNFKAKANIEPGEYQITVSKPATEVMFVNAAEQEVTARAYGKSIIVK